MKVSVSEIKEPENVMRQDMSEKGLENLARSMKEVGLRHPIGVQSVDGGYELVHGSRRLAAAKMLEWEEIEVDLIQASDDMIEAIKVMENREREDVSAIDAGRYFKDLVSKRGWTQKKLAEIFQVSSGYISQRIGALEWPKSLQEAITVGALSFSTAREIAGIRDYEHMLYIIQHAAANGATPTVAREWKRRANIDYEAKLRREAGEELSGGVEKVGEVMMYCHTCGKEVTLKVTTTYSVCTECRGLIEEVKWQGHFREHAEERGKDAEGVE